MKQLRAPNPSCMHEIIDVLERPCPKLKVITGNHMWSSLCLNGFVIATRLRIEANAHIYFVKAIRLRIEADAHIYAAVTVRHSVHEVRKHEKWIVFILHLDLPLRYWTWQTDALVRVCKEATTWEEYDLSPPAIQLLSASYLNTKFS